MARQGARSAFWKADGPIVPVPDDCAMTTVQPNAIEAATRNSNWPVDILSSDPPPKILPVCFVTNSLSDPAKAAIQLRAREN